MKILQIVPRFPFPEDDGGKIGIANIFKQFSLQGNEVTLFSFNYLDLSKESKVEAEKFGKVVIYKKDTKNSINRLLLNLFQKHSLFVSKFWSKDAIFYLEEILKSDKPDVIHCDHTSIAKIGLYLGKKYKIPVGIRLHNIEYQIFERFAATLHPFNPKGIYSFLQAEKLKYDEMNFLNLADINFPITQNDLETAKSLSPNAKFRLASAGIDINNWQNKNQITKNPKQMVIATTFEWIQNVEAVKWLIEKVLPLVKARISDFTFLIIGKKSNENFAKYENENIKVLGYVDSVKDYLHSSSIYLAPLFVGGGIRIKILEALACGLPVISTPISAEGIEIDKNLPSIFIEKNENEFADRIINLLRDTEKLLQYSDNATKFVTQTYSWEKNVKVMIDEYKKLIGKTNLESN